MMTRLTRPFALVGLLALLAPAGSALGGTTPAAAGIRLTRIAMVSPTTGWGQGDYRVFRTTDGAQSWTSVLRTPGKSRQGNPPIPFASIGSSEAWLVTKASRRGLWTYNTTNAGATWTLRRQTMPYPNFAYIPSQLVFADASHGWLLLYGGVGAGSAAYTILRTANGGRAWTVAQKAIACDGEVSYLSFLGATNGFRTGMCFAATQVQELFRTHDGGHTWHKFSVAAPPGFRVSYFNPGLVWVTGSRLLMPVSLLSPSAFVLYRSGDRGASWQPTKPIRVGRSCHAASPSGSPCVSSLGPPYAFDALNGSTSWVLINHVLHRTTDGGQRWYVMNPHTRFNAGQVQSFGTQLDFVSKHDGFALPPQANHVFVTSNSGRSWRKLTVRT